MSSVKVVIRVRPFNEREIFKGARKIVSVNGKAVQLTKPGGTGGSESRLTASIAEETQRAFTFDNCFWSFAESDDHFASQETVYNAVGKDILEHAFEGYNTCVFAYGQTGAGKSYSMMGYGQEKGVIPRACEELFSKIDANVDANTTFNVEVSYIEIYNERVRDLLNPVVKNNLRVREHPSLGPYVEDLSKLVVRSYEEIATLMDEGNKARTTAETNMNATSSRSHAVFTIILTQRSREPDLGITAEKVSRICLVDLAGSERADATGNTGLRLKEGANINKSLTTLGKVISALADLSTATGKEVARSKTNLSDVHGLSSAKQRKVHIPYRDSALTWLLKDCLGGNSKTVMIAAISPADVNYDETLSTLRYADRAKRIVNKAIVNEDSNARMLRELQQEISTLKSKLLRYESLELSPSAHVPSRESPASDAPSQLSGASGADELLGTEDVGALKDALKASEKLIAQITESFEDKLRRTQDLQVERGNANGDRSPTSPSEQSVTSSMNFQAPRIPHLLNLSEYPHFSESLLYPLPPGLYRVGSHDCADIRLVGPNILPSHCVMSADHTHKVTVRPEHDAPTMVNGRPINEPEILSAGDCIILGDRHIFRFNDPNAPPKQRRGGPIARPTSMLNPSIPSIADDGTASYFDSPSPTTSEQSIAMLYRQGRRLPASEGRGFTDEAYETGSEAPPKSMTSWKRGSRVRIQDTSHPRASMSWDAGDMSPSAGTSLTDPIRDGSSAVGTLPEPSTRSRRGRSFRDDLVREFASRWRSRKYVQIAREIVDAAAILKEANVIAKELDRNVLYQIALCSDTNTSFWEVTDCQQMPYGTAYHQCPVVGSFARLQRQRPIFRIKVLDGCNDSVYMWTSDTLRERLPLMRELYYLSDHSSGGYTPDTSCFYNAGDCPWFDRIGSAWVCVRNTIWGMTQEVNCDVVTETGHVKGCIKVVVSVIGSERTGAIEGQTASGRDELEDGETLLFEVSILSLGGILEEEFTQLHVQFSGESFGQERSAGGHAEDFDANRVFATDPATDFGTDVVVFDFSQTVRVKIGAAVRDTLLNGMMRFDVFGRRQKPVSEMIEETFHNRESQLVPADCQSDAPDDSCASPSSPQVPPFPGKQQTLPSKNGTSTSELRYPVLCQIEIAEASRSLGSYKPTLTEATKDTDAGSFLLRHGLQRRVGLRLTHSHGPQIRWKRITRVDIGKVRLSTKDGIIANEQPSVEMESDMVRLRVPRRQEAHENGRSLNIVCSWDSGAHECAWLNSMTRKGEKVLLRLHFTAEMEHPPSSAARLPEELHFETDIAVMIVDRDYNVRTSPRYLAGLLGLSSFGPIGGSRYLPYSSFVFNIIMRSSSATSRALTYTSHDASQGGTYIRGEEGLAGWKPHGPELIVQWEATRRRLANKLEADRLRQGFPEICQNVPSRNRTDSTRGNALLRKSLEIWRRRDPRDPSLHSLVLGNSASTTFGKDRYMAYKADVRHVERGPVVKRGAMSWVENGDDVWSKEWFVIRRPFLYVYADQSETKLCAVVGLEGIYLTHSPRLSEITKKPNIFAMQVRSSSILFQTPSLDELDAWINALDPLHAAAIISRRGMAARLLQIPKSQSTPDLRL
ncbi:uncharacterized protein EV422DRAFT_592939 [Fimicolochytrium jonesii]|uniref:uncharacterized protein n=1 Tax=Fimicolochytrium jonesii TaxID=1396493 RepID=UPI0022FE7388|nr:uncharacterized protein EV422DRAFT_592939 [Fimicolochytrium jonesii]KAI8826691.1 hypothetical protein EV422DRAFT_592939 [Fimicolochytrium jonesii]